MEKQKSLILIDTIHIFTVYQGEIKEWRKTLQCYDVFENKAKLIAWRIELLDDLW